MQVPTIGVGLYDDLVDTYTRLALVRTILTPWKDEIGIEPVLSELHNHFHDLDPLYIRLYKKATGVSGGPPLSPTARRQADAIFNEVVSKKGRFPAGHFLATIDRLPTYDKKTGDLVDPQTGKRLLRVEMGVKPGFISGLVRLAAKRGAAGLSRAKGLLRSVGQKIKRIWLRVRAPAAAATPGFVKTVGFAAVILAVAHGGQKLIKSVAKGAKDVLPEATNFAWAIVAVLVVVALTK